MAGSCLVKTEFILDKRSDKEQRWGKRQMTAGYEIRK